MKTLYTKKYRIPISVIFYTIVQMLVCFLSYVVNVNNLIVDCVSLALFILFLLSLFKQTPEILMKYLLFFFFGVWSIIAVFLMENGTVVLRGRESEHYGSLPIFIMSWVVFYFVITVLEYRNKKKLSFYGNCVNFSEVSLSKSQKFNATIIASVFVGLVAFCFLLIANKPYLLLGVDRFVYGQEILPSVIGILTPVFYAIVPLILVLRKVNLKLVVAYFILFSLLLIWSGEKFTGILILFYFCVIAMNPAYVGKQMAKKIRKITVVAVVVVLLFLFVVYVQQVVLYGVSVKEFFKTYLQDRIAAQGELWWLAFQKDREAGVHISEIWDEISIWIYQPKGKMNTYNFGIYKMMWKFMKTEWVNYTLTYGARATESTRVTFFYYGKAIGLFLGQGMLGVVVYHVVNQCIKFCNRGKWLVSVLYLYVLKNLITAFLMSDFQLLTTKKIILVYMLIFILNRLRIGNRIHSNTSVGRVEI